MAIIKILIDTKNDSKSLSELQFDYCFSSRGILVRFHPRNHSEYEGGVQTKQLSF